MRKLILVGTPSFYGGPNSELLHTLRIFKRFGLDVSLLTERPLDQDISGLLKNIPIFLAPDGNFNALDVRDSVLLSFGHSRFPLQFEAFKSVGCTTIWASCRVSITSEEAEAYNRGFVPDYWVFQTSFQRNKILSRFSDSGITPEESKIRQIRGAFDKELFPFRPRPHFPTQRFYVGRLSVSHPSKWRPDFFHLMMRASIPTYIIMMGVNSEIRRSIGFSPPWAVYLAPNSVRSSDFYSLLHCFVHANASGVENWPRVGLEAMASGVPLVVLLSDPEEGWKEMIKQEETGIMCNNDDEFVNAVRRLSQDEPFRNILIENAHDHLDNIANPEVIYSQWFSFLRELGVCN